MGRMKIKKTITLNITKDKKYITCYDRPTLHLILGSSAVSGNFKMYGVEKKGGEYKICIKKFNERLELLNYRLRKLDETIEIMNQIK